MNVRWLKDFITLADCQKFSLAAQLNASSQAAFSRRIQQLEQHLNVELFDRSRTPVKLTPEGKRLYPIAAEMVQMAERCEEMVANKPNPMVFASLHTLACNFFPQWFTQVLRYMKTPLVSSIDSGVRSVTGYQAALQSQRADCLLFYQSNQATRYFESDEFEVLKLADDALVWVCGASFPLELLEDASIPHLTYAPSSQLLELSLPLLNVTPQAKKLSVVFQSTISESLLPMAIHGNGVACIPYSVAKAYIDDGRLIHIWSDYRELLEIVLVRLADSKSPHPYINEVFKHAKTIAGQGEK
ncbi:LysR family transcriptional regulator [Vibrio rhizosphaerae]|uniref:LysR family transcriptional regulator n=1 Tax=Vibrio rhizosphaerae TaxID=398736 RepID=A0ABU4IWS8_9VIBR|nr:LysR family transcriptional regulator [Vibrio rhizosphaerae]MDW6093368.1 LysR family transcriptional regulator [Vibrio rhizosphaerae]